MAVRAPDIALLHLLQKNCLSRVVNHSRNFAILLAADMVKLKNPRIRLTTVHTRVSYKVSVDQAPIAFSMHDLPLVPARVVKSKIGDVVLTAVASLTRFTVGRQKVGPAVPAVELLCGLQGSTFRAAFPHAQQSRTGVRLSSP
jgi:hypothetical protein